MLGNEVNNDHLTATDYIGSGLAFYGQPTIGNCASFTYGYEAPSQDRTVGLFFNASASWRDMLFFNVTGRNDWSSTLPINKNSFFYPGVTLSGIFTRFIENKSVLSFGKVRIAYGKTGNDADPYYTTTNYAQAYTNGYYGNYIIKFPFNSANAFMASNTSGSNTLRPEMTSEFEVGTNLKFFNGRIDFDATYYNRVTDDQIFTLPIDPSTGFSYQVTNFGKVRNRGVELGLNGVAFTNRDVTVSLFANLTWNQNRVIKLADGSVEGTYSIIEEGRPYRQFYMPEYAGVNPENGMALYYLNAEGDETTEDYTEAAKRYVGSAEPKVYGAFGVNAKAYGFDFSMQFNYRLGNKVIDTGHSFTGWGMSQRTPLQIVADNSWTPENPNAKYPQYIQGDPYSTMGTSTRWLMNGSYLRLSNITFGYTLPAKVTRKAFMQKVRFYTTFDNVHTWTASDFVGYNPETYSAMNRHGSIPQHSHLPVVFRLHSNS